jgi:hypothetical protein
MDSLHQEMNRELKVVHLTRAGGQKVSFLADSQRVLCLQRRPGTPWEPTDPKNMGLAAAINRL